MTELPTEVTRDLETYLRMVYIGVDYGYYRSIIETSKNVFILSEPSMFIEPKMYRGIVIDYPPYDQDYSYIEKIKFIDDILDSEILAEVYNV